MPVTQAIRLEQGGVQLPVAIAGELGNMTLPLMNMGKGELQNVLVKLEMDGVLDAQSVLVGTMAAGETKQAKLTFTPRLDSVGTHSGTVTVTCEDAYGTRILIDEDDPSIAHFHLRWRRNDPIIGRIVTATFTDLVIDNGEDDEVIAEGTWQIKYTLRYPDATEELPVKSFDVTDNGGRKFNVKRIMLSPVGIHLDLVFSEPDYDGGIFKDFSMSLIMTDGTELALPDGGGGGSWTEGDKKADVDYYAESDIPIPREDIQAIVICGTTYELNNID